MEQTFEGIEISCECGEIHVLDSMSIEQNSAKKLIEYIYQKDFRKIRIFILREYLKNTQIKSIISELRCLKINVLIECFSVDFAQEITANGIECKGEEYVVVVGDYKAIDTIKYYCKVTGLDVGVIVAGRFLDFTFSKYARLYDGISYCFYSTIVPTHVVWFDEFCDSNTFEVKSYLKLKNIAYFENVLQGYLNEKNVCKKINTKLMKAIKLSNKINSSENAFFMCVFLGRAMSFFGGTKAFFGAEIDVCGMLEVKTKKSFFECYLLASELIIEVYKAALKGNIRILNFNLNCRIDNIKKILKLSAICCMSFVKKHKSIQDLEKYKRIVSALKYMLLGVIEGKTNNLAFDISKKLLIESLYVAPEFSIRYVFLNFLRDLGYLENLLN